ncbi:type II CAAX endopeptidase family protein [uncultured Chryseobacterium sp.]|uniref:CPBP family intramembrane glutamic endopeptidase n=1 Tax=uncultured Chryseobacterium sp. TaxID=259322 RepID=UPI002583B4BE|nr:type II CAAX endopeptidase family protein [uncultured Chryseobacterium sp.]
MGINGKYSIGILLTFVLLAAAMLYAFPAVTLITGIRGITGTNFLITRFIIWGIFFIVLLYSFFIEKESLLLKKEIRYSLVFYLKAVVCLYFICSIGGALLNIIIHLLVQEKISGKLFELTPIFKSNYFLLIFTCFTAGAVEELLMRGYIQSRIEKIYNNSAVGIIFSAVLFGILHSTYGTIGQVVIPFFIGVVFAVFYKIYSNIKILIICHFMIDFISLVAMNFMDIKHLSLF